MPVYRIIVSPRKRVPDIFKIYNLEIEGGDGLDLSVLHPVFANPLTEKVVKRMPEGDFIEVMYKNQVTDPEEQSIQKAAAKKGVIVQAAKVGYRYYGSEKDRVYVNKLIHTAYTGEPKLETLIPRGERKPMEYFDLTAMNDSDLLLISQRRELHLSLIEMKRLAEIQRELRQEEVTDVFLETFAASWSDHCNHKTWKSLGLFTLIKSATEKIGNSNLLSAFVDNAGVWSFYKGLAILFKLETHNSPTQSYPYGGQATKLGGVIRDPLETGLGAKPIGNIELTVLGEFVRRQYPELEGLAIPTTIMAKETIKAIADYGNPMGIPMIWAKMMSHPDFSGKPFALGGTVGITTYEAAQKGIPRKGDLAVLVGGKTGNDGLHGATVSSSGIDQFTDTGELTHVQIGHPFTEQKMMRATVELRDKGCKRGGNDFGAAGIVSAMGELGKLTDGVGGLIINLALVPLKYRGLSNWQIALSESQERFADVVIPEKLAEAIEIYEKYELEWTIVGVFTDSGKFQMFYDPERKDFSPDMELSGEICLDVPYSHLDNYPLPKIKAIEPPVKSGEVSYPGITMDNVQEMAEKVVGHFDVCDQSFGTTQYDSTVQGITFQGPLYGKNYNVPTSLGILKPVYGKPFGATITLSFSPWQFEVDPVGAAINAMMDALVTQVVAGVKLKDICLADNFYTSDKDPYAYWYLREQVQVICELSLRTGTPFITGKDSSSGSGAFGGRTVNVPASVCITAMGKISDVKKIVLHKWKSSGNILMAFGPKPERLDGSILSSSLGKTGTKLDVFPVERASQYLREVNLLARTGKIKSAVPINRGGLILRLFEGVEASNFGVSVCVPPEELFPESFGGALVEVEERFAEEILRLRPILNPRIIGRITGKGKTIEINGKRIDWRKLHNIWSTTFKKTIEGVRK